MSLNEDFDLTTHDRRVEQIIMNGVPAMASICSAMFEHFEDIDLDARGRSLIMVQAFKAMLEANTRLGEIEE